MNKIIALIKYIFITLGQLALIVGIPVAIFGWFVSVDIHRVRDFCYDVKPGTSFNALISIAKYHDLDISKIINKSIFSEQNKKYLLIVPVDKTMGEFSCFIYHDKQQVISTEMNGS